MPKTDDRHPDEIAQELTSNLPPGVRGSLLSSYIGTQVCDEECPPGCEPANKCRLDTYDDHRACIECWLLYMARAAGVALSDGTVRPCRPTPASAVAMSARTTTLSVRDAAARAETP